MTANERTTGPDAQAAVAARALPAPFARPPLYVDALGRPADEVGSASLPTSDLIGVGRVRDEIFSFGTVLDLVLLQNPRGQISRLNAKLRHCRCLEKEAFLRTAQSIKISNPFSEQIQNCSAGTDVQSQKKRIWNNQSPGEELDHQWIFELVVVTFRTGTIYDVANAQNSIFPGPTERNF